MAGNLKVSSVQLGDSVTATQNFVLASIGDGTAKLSRGNIGATTQDILTVDNTGKVTSDQVYQTQSVLLAENNDFLVQENGSYLVIE